MKDEVRAILEQVRQRDPHQTEFLQAVDEVVESLGPLFEKEPKYIKVCFRVSLRPRRLFCLTHFVEPKRNVYYGT